MTDAPHEYTANAAEGDVSSAAAAEASDEENGDGSILDEAGGDDIDGVNETVSSVYMLPLMHRERGENTDDAQGDVVEHNATHCLRRCWMHQLV